MRRFLLLTFAALAFLVPTSPAVAQEDAPASVSLQVWTPTTFDLDAVPDFLGTVSFGPVLHFSENHSIGMHANFLDAILGDDEDDPTATVAYTFSHGPISVGAGVTFANMDNDDEEDSWEAQPGFGLGYRNLALWLNGEQGSIGVTVPLF